MPNVFTKGKMGLDGNRPIDVASGALAQQMATPGIITDTGAAFVRINFIRGPWSSPQDTTLHAGRTWFQAYDAIVDAFVNLGVGVYALVGAECTQAGDPGDRMRAQGDNAPANAWLQTYAADFRAIAQHFAGRVKLFESFNEPNDWHGGSSNWLHPYWFAKLLKSVYQAAKIDAGLDVTLVSGPLLTHDLTGGGDDGTYYLDQTYRMGRTYHAWEQFLSDNGTYPLDDIGYHIYVANDAGDTAQDVQTIFNQYLAAIAATITRYEGQLTDKGLHVSEYGWTSDNGEALQTSKLQAGFRLLRDSRLVKTASLFCLQDFPSQNYGLYRSGAFVVGNRKQAYAAFQALEAESVPQTQVGYDAQGHYYPAIAAAYQRNGGAAALGQPFDNGGTDAVHRWGSGVVQDFKTAGGSMAIIMFRDATNDAYVLRGVIRHRYVYTYGGAEGALGYPTADQSTDEWGLPRCTFEHGEIGCRTYTEFYD